MKSEKEKVLFLNGASFFILPDKLIGVFVSGNTTPSIENNETWKAGNTAPLTITNFLKGAVGQRLIVLGDGFTSVAHNTYIKNNTGATKLLASNKVYRFTLIDDTWYEDA